MHIGIKFLFFWPLLALATGCAQPGNRSGVGDMGTGELSGGLMGAAAGGLLGNQFGGRGSGKALATLGGVLVGGFVGSRIGQSLDQDSRNRADRASQDALENARTGQQVDWNNPDQGTSGYVVARPSYQRPAQQVYGPDYGAYGYSNPNDVTVCREYTQTIFVNGSNRPETLVGTACRQADGSWRPINS
jgi:surface antigen